MSTELDVTEYSSAPAFLAAWLRGVELAGHRWFGDGSSERPYPATEKDDLAPRYVDIVNALGILSSGEAAFLVAMYSFYNSHAAQAMWEAVDSDLLAGLSANLDEPRRRVIADLLVAYEGW